MSEQAAARTLTGQAREQSLDAAAGEAHPQVIAGHCLDGVSLVEDDNIVWR